MPKKRAMSSEKAREVKLKGHEDAREFAITLGLGKEFKADPKAKKDVIDENGYSYSVKSGEKKWQIFLYGESRFKSDTEFRAVNLSKTFLECINSFPKERSKYLENKVSYKIKLQKPIQKLKQKLQNKNKLRLFLNKGIFNSGEVNFLAIKDKNLFHVFYNDDIIDLLTRLFTVENSKAKAKNQLDDQKVIFKIDSKTYGEIEMRNDSDVHYREVKFWLDRNLILSLLIDRIQPNKKLNERIILYGRAINKLLKRGR
jgi:hypothetical protein